MQQTTVSLESLPIEMQRRANETKMNIASWVFKYQKFRTKIALQHAPEGYSKSTLQNYFDYGLRYIKNGLKTGNYSALYSNIDTLIKKHTQPLTPSEIDARVISKRDYTKKNNIPPVAKLEIIQKPVSAKFQYGIRSGDEIRLCPSEDYAMGYLDCLKRNSDTDAKVITLEIGEP